jgi:S1-C subfamily serine protease
MLGNTRQMLFAAALIAMLGCERDAGDSAQSVGETNPATSVEGVSQVGMQAAPSLGISIDNPARFEESSRSDGARVTWVLEGGVADNAGIQVGDIITRIADQTVGAWGDLPTIVRGLEFGTSVEVGVDRSGESLIFTAVFPSAADEQGDRQ